MHLMGTCLNPKGRRSKKPGLQPLGWVEYMLKGRLKIQHGSQSNLHKTVPFEASLERCPDKRHYKGSSARAWDWRGMAGGIRECCSSSAGPEGAIPSPVSPAHPQAFPDGPEQGPVLENLEAPSLK